jgi:hypothetical protein
LLLVARKATSLSCPPNVGAEVPIHFGSKTYQLARAKQRACTLDRERKRERESARARERERERSSTVLACTAALVAP